MIKNAMSLKAQIRVSIQASYDTIVTLLSIDSTTGDVITPQEVLYLFKMIFEQGTIWVGAYNIGTVFTMST